MYVSMFGILLSLISFLFLNKHFLAAKSLCILVNKPCIYLPSMAAFKRVNRFLVDNINIRIYLTFK